jgi:hypothetical protein
MTDRRRSDSWRTTTARLPTSAGALEGVQKILTGPLGSPWV